MEFYIRRSLEFLAPETVERRQLGFLKPGYVNPLVQFEGGCYRLSDDCACLAKGEPQENVSVGYPAGSRWSIARSATRGT